LKNRWFFFIIDWGVQGGACYVHYVRQKYIVSKYKMSEIYNYLPSKYHISTLKIQRKYIGYVVIVIISCTPISVVIPVIPVYRCTEKGLITHMVRFCCLFLLLVYLLFSSPSSSSLLFLSSLHPSLIQSLALTDWLLCVLCRTSRYRCGKWLRATSIWRALKTKQEIVAWHPHQGKSVNGKMQISLVCFLLFLSFVWLTISLLCVCFYLYLLVCFYTFFWF